MNNSIFPGREQLAEHFFNGPGQIIVKFAGRIIQYLGSGVEVQKNIVEAFRELRIDLFEVEYSVPREECQIVNM